MLPPSRANNVVSTAQAVIRLAEETIQQCRLERRFAVFPLLLAGIVLPAQDAQRQIRNLLDAFNQVTLGCNTWTTLNVFDRICERHAESEPGGTAVDLKTTINETELQLISLGL